MKANDSTFWRCKVLCADIRRGSLRRRRQVTVGLSIRAIFSVFAGYFFRNFRAEASVILQRYAGRRRIFSGPKCMTLNDLEWLFRVKFCFRTGLAGSLQPWHNCTKTNKDRHILSQSKSSQEFYSVRQKKVSPKVSCHFLSNHLEFLREILRVYLYYLFIYT